MTIKRLIGTIDAAALGEDRAKIRAEYIESDSISSIMSCLRRDDEVESQSTSEALAQQGDLVSENVQLFSTTALATACLTHGPQQLFTTALNECVHT